MKIFIIIFISLVCSNIAEVMVPSLTLLQKDGIFKIFLIRYPQKVIN
jgi:hypothetical protein